MATHVPQPSSQDTKSHSHSHADISANNAKVLKTDFASIPPVTAANGTRMPHGCAWGMWDINGARDQMGTLNLLTPQNSLAAKDELRDGDSVALNWGMHNVTHPGFKRKPLHRRVFEVKPFKAFDDEIEFNTQAGSQWDGFKHWGHQRTGLYYNDLKHEDVAESVDNGIHHWTLRGGIVGRGVLLDYVAHAERKGIKVNAWSRHEITVKDLEEIVEYEGLTLRPGDVLIIRSGFVKQYMESSEEQQIQSIQNGHDFIGIQGSEEMVQWLWNHHFSAIAGDTIAMEAWPPVEPWVIHDFSLAFWGEPIGELWNLEELAKRCESKKRWSFFLTSAPLNVHKGVGTPPNALAIF